MNLCAGEALSLIQLRQVAPRKKEGMFFARHCKHCRAIRKANSRAPVAHTHTADTLLTVGWINKSDAYCYSQMIIRMAPKFWLTLSTCSLVHFAGSPTAQLTVRKHLLCPLIHHALTASWPKNCHLAKRARRFTTLLLHARIVLLFLLGEGPVLIHRLICMCLTDFSFWL